MKKRCIYLFFALLIFAAGALIGCGKNDAGKQTGATSEDPIGDDPAGNGEVGDLINKYLDDSATDAYDPTGRFYKQGVEGFLTVQPAEINDAFDLTLPEDVSSAFEFSFKTPETDGAIMADDGSSCEIVLHAGGSFTWQANKAHPTANVTYLYIEVTAKLRGSYVAYGAVRFSLSSKGKVNFDRTRLYVFPETDGKLQEIDERRLNLALRAEHVVYDRNDETNGNEHFRIGANNKIYLDIPIEGKDVNSAIDGTAITIVFNDGYKNLLPDFATAIEYTGVELECGVTFKGDVSILNWITAPDYSYGYVQAAFADYRAYNEGYEKFFAVVEYLRTLDCVDYVGMIPPMTGA